MYEGNVIIYHRASIFPSPPLKHSILDVIDYGFLAHRGTHVDTVRGTLDIAIRLYTP